MTDFAAEFSSHSRLSGKSAFSIVAAIGLRVGISRDVVRDTPDNVRAG
jgi:hypothetical protein